MPRIVFPDCTPDLLPMFDDAIRALVPGLEVHVGRPGEAELLSLIRDADAVVHFYSRLTDDILAACPRLKATVFLGTGVESWVDMKAAERLGIRVRRVLGYGDRTIAEHTIALVFACVRKIAAMDRAIRDGRWGSDTLYELEGRTLGLIGLGGCGRMTARIAAAIGLDVIGWNRSPVPAEVPCRMMDLDAVLARADIVSLHLALNEHTRGTIDRRRLGLMKRGAVFVNTARGALVDEPALIALLESGHLAAAGLDVFETEPLPADHPLARLPNVTLTAHAAWKSPEASRRVLRLGLEIMREEARQLWGVGG